MIKCDICGSELVMLAGGKGAACKNCGMEHSVERIREMICENSSEDTMATVQPAVKEKAKSTVVADEEIHITKKVETTEEANEEEIYTIEDFEIIDDNVEELDDEEADYDDLTESDETDFIVKKSWGKLQIKGYTGNAQRVVFPVGDIVIKDPSIFRGHDEIVEMIFNGNFDDDGIKIDLDELENLRKVVVNGDMNGFETFKNSNSIREVIIKGGPISTLLTDTFKGCPNLQKVEIGPDTTLVTFGEIFKNCTSLREFIYPTTMNFEYDNDGVHHHAFEGCTSLRRVVIPNNAKAIHKNAFKNCTSLESVTTHNGDLSTVAIHPQAFSGSSFQPENVGICPECGRKLKYKNPENDCEDMYCSCGFSTFDFA